MFQSVRNISVPLGKSQDMAVRLLRAVYAIEFLVALAALSIFWRETAGQFHLDLMPWFLKFGFLFGMAVTLVKLTSISLEGSRRAKVFWMAVATVIILAAGLATYYYHLHEPLDEEEDGITLSTKL